jgi:CubicO group peptidase (beta-lactamase class C family)
MLKQGAYHCESFAEVHLMAHKKTFISLFLCVALLIARSAEAGEIVKGRLARRIDEFLSRLSGFGYSGVILVVKDGKRILRKGYGLADEEASVPNTPETVFDIGSLAKQFTAAAILKLETQGKLKITDTIDRYLPGVPQDKSGITIEQLLSHTSGLDSDFPLVDPTGNYYEEVNRTDAIRRILEVPLVGEPGKSFAYSNAGYVLLAAIVEIASETPFRDFLRTSFFQPAGMQSTGFWGNGLPPVKESLIAHSYDESGETGDPRKWSDTTWFDLGGGEIVSTAEDLYKWSAALKNGSILPPEAVQRLFTPRMNDYGYGWFIRKTPRGTTLIQHGGNYVGFGSDFSWFRDEDVLMIILTNRSNQVFGANHIASRLVPQIIFGAKEYHMREGDAFEIPPRSTPVEPSFAQKVAGTYQLSTGGRIVIQTTKRGLEIGGMGQDAVNALADASEAELQRRARLNERAHAIVSGIARGDSNALPSEWLRPGAPREGYMNALQTGLKEAVRENGALRSIEVVGTAPGAFPVGVLQTKVRFNCERGGEEFQFNWINERINSTSQAPPLLATTPLRGDGKNLVGWSIIWFKGFTVSFRSAHGKVESLTIHHQDRDVEARRIPA